MTQLCLLGARGIDFMTLQQLSIYDFGINPPSLTGFVSDTNSPSITGFVSDTNSPSITGFVSDTKTQAVLRFLNRAVTTGKGSVGIYKPSGDNRKAQYFRFSYRDGNRTKHRHIPGGNIYSSLALERAKKVQQMADSEVSIDSILLCIGNFS